MNGFVIGCHHGLIAEQLDYLEYTIEAFIKSKQG